TSLRVHRHRPSFPTRRSSDLLPALTEALDDAHARDARGGWPPLLADLCRRAGCRGAEARLSGRAGPGARLAPRLRSGAFAAGRRSEEHTSELQSRENLVCRLL